MEGRDDRSASRKVLKKMASIKISLILICAFIFDCFLPRNTAVFLHTDVTTEA